MLEDAIGVVAKVFECYMSGDLSSVEPMLAPDIIWYGIEPDSACHDRVEVLDFLSYQRELGLSPILEEISMPGDKVLAVIRIPGIAAFETSDRDECGYHVVTVREGRVIEIRDHPDRESALEACREN